VRTAPVALSSAALLFRPERRAVARVADHINSAAQRKKQAAARHLTWFFRAVLCAQYVLYVKAIREADRPSL